jgi:N-acetylmuramoyl-L-alanine amidase
MKRKLWKIIPLLGMLCALFCVQAFAAETATPTTSTVLVNGSSVQFEAYTVGQNNYFKLRDLAKALNGTDKQFNVTWDQANQAIGIQSGKAYQAVGGELAVSGNPSAKAAVLNTSAIYLDQTKVSLTAYTIQQNNYFKLRDVAAKLNFGVEWNQSQNTISIDTTKGYTDENTKPAESNNSYQGQGIGTAVSKDEMSLRDQASVSGTSYGVVSKGTSLEVLERLSNGWLKVVWPQSAVGYAYTSNVNSRYYTVTLNNDNSSDTPETPDTPDTPTTPDTPSKPNNGTTHIILDAGHGGSDSGAVLRDSNGNVIYKESELALGITKKLGALLEKNGIQISYTRTTDTYPTLPDRANQANREGADLFVCVHLNSAGVSAKGIETLIAGTGGEAEKLAKAVQAQLIADTGATNRGIKERPGLYVLKNTNMPAILIETGFISNPTEAAKLASDSYQQTVANAIAKGICKYLGKTYVS